MLFQQYYQSFCYYLLKMGLMDEEQAVFEQLTLSNFEKSSRSIKVALSSLRIFLETESPLKILKNAFHLKYSSRSHDI